VRLPSARGASRGAVACEANLFSRVGRVISSYTNSLINSAEDPEKMLDQVVVEMNEDLVKMRQASAQVMASQKQLENKYNAATKSSEEWYRRAQLALEKGDEDLAREALTRRKSFQSTAESLEGQLEQQRSAVSQLVANTRQLESKLAEAKSKKDTLKARAQSAKTSKQVNEMLGSVGTSNAYSAFERMEEKVMSLEAESEAVEQLAIGSGGSSDASLEAKFAALEGSSVDDELAALKGDIGGKKSALPEGRPVSDAIESELDALRKKADGL